MYSPWVSWGKLDGCVAKIPGRRLPFEAFARQAPDWVASLSFDLHQSMNLEVIHMNVYMFRIM